MNIFFQNDAFQKRFYLGLFFLFTALAWWRMAQFAENCGFFVDESIHFTHAAASFFSNLNYTGLTYNHPFDPRMSSGIAASWPTGLSWNAGFSIFTQRIFLIVYCWGQFTIAGYILLKRFGLSKAAALCFTGFLWMFLLRHIPNTLGFIQNLGEVEAGLLLLWALVLFPLAPFWAFVCLGISVWLAKLVFLPAAFALGAAYWLSTAKLEGKEIFRFSKFIAAFFLPLAIWILLIVFRFGWDGFLNWAVEFYRFVFVEGPSGASGGGKLTFAERMARFEWGTYNFTLKIKILLYAFGPLFCGWILFFKGNRFEKLLAVFVPAILLLYSAWWFLANPEMYLRHFHPALFMGFGFLTYMSLKGINYSIKRNKKRTIVLVGMFILFATLLELRLLKRDTWPFWAEGVSYARACKGPVWNETCAPGFQ